MCSAGKHRDRWNRADAEALAEIRHFVCVHFHDHDASGLTRGDLLHLRSDHPARPAPRRPVIDDDRQRRARDETIEIGGGTNLDRFTR